MAEDIVTRLRNWHTDHDSAVPRPIDLEAADEIERLRAELDHWKALAIHNDNLAQIQAGICPPIPHYEEKQ